MRPVTRSYVEYVIDHLIGLLDQFDGDPDFEDCDLEPEPADVWLSGLATDRAPPRQLRRAG